MSERLTAWEGHNVDGTPRAVIAKRDGLFPDLLQPILKKLAEYEDAEAHPEHTFWTTQHEALLNIPAADVRPVVVCADCKHNNACLTQAFVEDASRLPFDRSTFFCADGKRADDV